MAKEPYLLHPYPIRKRENIFKNTKPNPIAGKFESTRRELNYQFDMNIG